LPIGDVPSAEAFFALLSDYKIQTLWGEVFAAEVTTKMCPTNPTYCEIFLQLNEQYAENYASGGSLKNFTHFIEMAIEGRFQEYISSPDLYPAI
jgi:hypothetical protein